MPRKLPESLGLVCLSAAAFALAHPNPLFPRGLGALAFFFFLPAAAALRGARPGRAALQGALFALVGYGLMDSWLAAYDPIAPLVVLPLTACYYAGLFAALAALGRAFPRWIWATWPFAWVGLEFAKTLGFLGYPYGILGYALYEHLPWPRRPRPRASSASRLWRCGPRPSSRRNSPRVSLPRRTRLDRPARRERAVHAGQPARPARRGRAAPSSWASWPSAKPRASRGWPFP